MESTCELYWFEDNSITEQDTNESHSNHYVIERLNLESCQDYNDSVLPSWAVYIFTGSFHQEWQWVLSSNHIRKQWQQVPGQDTDLVLEERGYAGKLVRTQYCTLWACTVKQIISGANDPSGCEYTIAHRQLTEICLKIAAALLFTCAAAQMNSFPLVT